jgi:type II secretory pathway component PulF
VNFIYRYSGVDKGGTSKEGRVTAKSRKEAMEQVSRTIDITHMVLEGFSFGDGKVQMNKQKYSVLFSQLSYLLESGIPMHRAIQCLQEAGDPAIQDVANSMLVDIADGKPLSESILNLGGAIALRFQPQLEAGERGANVEQTMKEIAIQLKKEQKNESSIRTALVYPGFIFVMAIAISAFLLVSVVPDIANIMTEMGTSLPYITRLLISISDFIGKFGLLVLAGVVGLGYLFMKWVKGKGKLKFDSLILKVPVMGEMIINKDQINFYRNLYYMMNAGLPFVPAIRYACATISNLRFKTDLENSALRVQNEGIDLASAMADIKYIDPIHLQSIKVGIEANRLQQTLFDTAEHLEEVNAETTERFKAMLNPLLLIVVGVLVGFIMIAMYMPMFSVMGDM